MDQPKQVTSQNPNHAGSVLSTIGSGGRRIWQYPVWFSGRMIRVRTLFHLLLLVLLAAGPWIDVGGHPAIRFDIAHRRAYLWGFQFFATDGVYIVLTLLSALFAIFLFTALFGRAWCGWACPQTVFLETLIRPIERLIEGSSMQRKRLDDRPWSFKKIVRKGMKLAAYLTVCGAIGTTFVAYFLGREGVIEAQFNPFSHPAGTAIFVSITGLTLFDFGWFREQTCLVMCPYGRFQSVLLDRDSWGVGYDYQRGEPRGKVTKKSLPIVQGENAKGDCVDCRRCVQVCPTGIDIRNGPQLECVQCMACIDVCDDTMAKVKRPSGLIRLDSERVFAGEKRSIARPRVFAYALGLLVTTTALTLTFAGHEPVEINLSRQKGATYTTLPNGHIQNALSIRVANKTSHPRTFTIALLGNADGEINLFTPVSPITVRGGDVAHVPVFVSQSAALKHGHIMLEIRDDADFVTTKKFDFLASSTAASQLDAETKPH
jgi:cytochrome c oxidase accessory protein FixG